MPVSRRSPVPPRPRDLTTRRLRRHALNSGTRLLPDGGARFARISETRQGGNQDARVIDALIAAAMVHSYAVEANAVPEQEVMVSWA